MNRFILVIKTLLDKPGMFAIDKVEDVFFIMDGYSIGLSSIEQDSLLLGEVSEFKLNFRKFINKRYGSKKNFDSIKLIRLYSGSDKHSLELFSMLLSEYLEKEAKAAKLK